MDSDAGAGDRKHRARVWTKGNYWEDFSVGQRFEHHWGRTLWHSDNALFSTSTLSWLPVHLNVAYARGEGFDDVVLHPLLVFCTVLGMSVEDLSESGGAFLGVDDLRFHASAHPGSTILGSSTVLSMRESQSRPTQGIITWHTQGRDSTGELLLDFTRTNLILRKPIAEAM